MFVLFFLLFLASLVMIPVALINPKFATKGKYTSRKKALYAYGGAMIVSFMLAIATTPPSTPTTQVAGEKVEFAETEVKNDQQTPAESILPFTETKTPEPLFNPTASHTVNPSNTPKPTSTSYAKPTPIDTPNPSTTIPISEGGACKYSCIAPDRDCGDFSSHSEAQSFFNCCGFSATNDPMKLDGRGNSLDDGIACEN